MIKAGNTKPYIAPVYGSYVETIKGLMAQGWRAFYKGLFYRFIHTSFHFWPYAYLNFLISNDEIQNNSIKSVLFIYFGKIMLDSSLNMFHIQ